jgi:hypothetical protein
MLSFDNQVNAKGNVIRFKQLEWSDFNGFPKLFSEFDAEIHTEIQVTFDSILGRYVAFPVMNRNRSWVHVSAKESKHLLRHEQYHFEITNYYAQKLDRIIVEENHKYRSSIQFELNHIVEEANFMQELYDRETYHSLVESEQRNWEYKIDSLLSTLGEDNGTVRDNYSGAQVFLTDPHFSVEYDSIANDLRRYYFSESYDMYRTLTSVNYNYYSNDLEGIIANVYHENPSIELLSIEGKKVNGNQEIHIRTKDTVNDSHLIERRVYANRCTYIVSAFFYDDQEDTRVSEAIANSFIESFKIHNNEKYWIEIFKKDTANEYVKTTYDKSLKSELITADNCIEYTTPSYKGFIGEPIALNNRSAIIPYFLTDSMKDKVDKLVLSYDRTHHLFQVDSTESIFHLPESAMKDRILIGYTLKKDSLEDCTPIYYTVLE